SYIVITACNVLGGIDPLIASDYAVIVYINRHLRHMAAIDIHFIDITTLFKNDGISTYRRKLDIIVREVRHLAHVLGFEVVLENIHRAIAIAEEENPVTMPHRHNILCGIVCDILHLPGGEIVDINIIGHTAAVILPCAELAEDLVHRQTFSIWRIGAPATN